tara:strand:+ start:176 stop:313 length:138 start_codon:yes stop_codon:yes gene_type:complete
MLGVLFGKFKQIIDCWFSIVAAAKLQLLLDSSQSNSAFLTELIKN